MSQVMKPEKTGAADASAPEARDKSAATRLFDRYPGPVVMLDQHGHLHPLNGPGDSFRDYLNSDIGAPLMPQIIQLTIRGRTELAGKSRILTLTDSNKRMEITALPQEDGTTLIIGRDATLEVNIRSALAESRGRFKDLVDVAADFAWETDRDGKFSYLSPQGAFGYLPEELLGDTPETHMLDPNSSPSPLPFHTRETVRNVETWVRHRDGEPRCYLISAIPSNTGIEKDPRNPWAGARGIAINVTNDRIQQSELARMKIRERLIAYIVDSLRNEVQPTAMLDAAATALGRSTSSRACILRVKNEAGEPVNAAVFGDAPDPATLAECESRLDSSEHVIDGSDADWRCLAAASNYHGQVNGSITLWRAHDAPDWDEDERALLAAIIPQFGIVFRQILDQEALQHLSRTDELTGLPNRRAFLEDLERELFRCNRYNVSGAVLFVDLDNFKPVNDRYGHERGDRVLQQIATILRSETRPYDLVCRLGGDEFAIWMERARLETARTRARQLLDRFRNWARSQDLDVSASIGIALFHPNRSETVEQLIVRADKAMYAAKEKGKSAVDFVPQDESLGDEALGDETLGDETLGDDENEDIIDPGARETGCGRKDRDESD